MKKSIALIATISFLLTACSFFDTIAPGGLNGAKSYTLSASREKVINAVHIFYSEHPDMYPPDTLRFQVGFPKSTEGNDITTFYYLYFYYPDQNKYMSALIRDDKETKTSEFFFHGYN